MGAFQGRNPPFPCPPPHMAGSWGVKGGGCWLGEGAVSRAPTACLAPPTMPAAHLHPVVGKEGLGVSLGGQVQTGGPAPAAVPAHQQGEGAVLTVAVALGEEACPGTGCWHPVPAPPSRCLRPIQTLQDGPLCPAPTSQGAVPARPACHVDADCPRLACPEPSHPCRDRGRLSPRHRAQHVPRCGAVSSSLCSHLSLS